MLKIHQQRKVLWAVASLAGLLILNGGVFFLMSGEHSISDYLFSKSQWSLLSGKEEPIFILSLNVMFLFSVMAFFSFQRVPTNDDIGKAVLHVAIFACLTGLFLAFSRVGVISRMAFLSTITMTAIFILGVNWLVLRTRPFVLVDCSESPLEDAPVKGLNIRSISEWKFGDREIDRSDIEGIIVGRESDLALELVRPLISSDVKIFDRGQLWEQLSGRIELDSQATPEKFAFSEKKGYLLFRRIIDVTFSLFVSPFGFLVLFVFGVIIRFEGPGPFLFVQRRVGKRGKEFNLYKLRTMMPEDQNRPTFASENTHRITRAGRLARRWRVDEIPQFWNILIGDMTLIGPRPEQAGFVAEFESEIPFYGLRHRMRPGLTGWAQVNQGYAEGHDETRVKLAYDLFYVKNSSPWLDALIILKTLYFIIRGEN